uniref:Uncharacterized protein n=1 Tax=Arundo donax TaxID=35708 RepID=A0A0A9B9H1_ARUDO
MQGKMFARNINPLYTASKTISRRGPKGGHVFRV